MSSTAVLIPLSGIVLFFAGFSCLGFAFAALDTTGRDAIVYYVFNGLGVVCSILGAVPVQLRLRRRSTEMCLANACLSCVFFIVAIVFGVLKNYHAYTPLLVPFGGALFFLAWITAVCSTLANAALAFFALMALYPPPSCSQHYPGVCPALDAPTSEEEPPKLRSTSSRPMSRRDLRPSV